MNVFLYSQSTIFLETGSLHLNLTVSARFSGHRVHGICLLSSHPQHWCYRHTLTPSSYMGSADPNSHCITSPLPTEPAPQHRARTFRPLGLLFPLMPSLFILQHMDSGFCVRSPLLLALAPFNNMVLTKNIKTSCLTFLVLVHNVA